MTNRMQTPMADDDKDKKLSSGKIAREHMRTLQHRRKRLADVPALADEFTAIEWALEVLGRVQWKRVSAERPTPGQAVFIVSNVAGLGAAVWTNNTFLCSCGCGSPIPAVTHWCAGPPTPGPTWEGPKQ